MDEGQIHRGRGLVDLIAGVTPTLSGWTEDPTDAANITDGDLTTFCTTGNKVCPGGYHNALLEWDLGAFYNVLCDGVMGINTDAGTAYVRYEFWSGVSWVAAYANSYDSNSGAIYSVSPYCSQADKIRIRIYPSAAATITPNIREFHAWRL